jgi:hypothetical protein
MADLPEKKQDDALAHEEEEQTMEKHNVVETKVLHGDEAFQQAMLKEPPIPWNAIAIQLYLISIVGFFCSTSNGYDSSLFNNLLNNKAFKAFFNVKNVGIWAGIVTSMNQIGGVTALPFVGPAIDTFGRRVGMMIGGVTSKHFLGQFSPNIDNI